jgi:hypothetical protein
MEKGDIPLRMSEFLQHYFHDLHTGQIPKTPCIVNFFYDLIIAISILHFPAPKILPSLFGNALSVSYTILILFARKEGLGKSKKIPYIQLLG